MLGRKGRGEDTKGKCVLGFTASDLATSGQQPDSYGHVENLLDFTWDFKEGTVQHTWGLHTKGSQPISSNIIQERIGLVQGHCQASIKRNYTIKVVTWHSTLLNCKLNTSISA